MAVLQLCLHPAKGILITFDFLMVMNKSVTNIPPVDFCVGYEFSKSVW